MFQGAPAADRPRSVAELLKLYSHTAFSGHAESPPLQIVDVGVSLPETPFEEAKDGKLAAEWAYRIQWRNYFRREIFPRLLKCVRLRNTVLTFIDSILNCCK